MRGLRAAGCVLGLVGVAALDCRAAGEAAAAGSESAGRTAAIEAGRPDSLPNILLILADDLGYSDLGRFGGEIHTPNIDALAGQGVVFTDFHVAPNCSPTRAMLLTGTDPHVSGLGTMVEHRTQNQSGRPGYEGYLNNRVVTIARLLQDAGYHTYMTGKWHLGKTAETSPRARGFERSFALLSGGASYFDDRRGLTSKAPKALYREDGELVESLPDDFYATQFYTDRMMDYIDGGRADKKPFFAYLAYTAVHWPLQLPDEYLDKYKGRYDEGYDSLRQARFESAVRRGIIEPGARPSGALAAVKPWSDLSAEERRLEARKMEIYAALADNMDHHVGRIVRYLKDKGLYDDTVVIFMSDNGPEGNDRLALEDNREWIPETWDNSFENLGRRNSYVYYGAGWAQASAAPFRLFKAYPSEGGIRAPLIIKPATASEVRVSRAFLTAKDIAPTLLNWAHTEHPGESYEGRTIHPLTGRSIAPIISGEASEVHSAEERHGWEIFGQRAVRKGDWKLLWLHPVGGQGSWALYNLQDDPGETRNLAARFPEKVEELQQDWAGYARDNGVVLPQGDMGGPYTY